MINKFVHHDPEACEYKNLFEFSPNIPCFPNAGEPIERAVYTTAFVKQKLNKIKFFMVYNKEKVFPQSDQDALGISVILNIFFAATIQNDFVFER